MPSGGKKDERDTRIKNKRKKTSYQFYKIRKKKKKYLKFIDVHTLPAHIRSIKFNPHSAGYNILREGRDLNKINKTAPISRHKTHVILH